jgi:hypothetical protein
MVGQWNKAIFSSDWVQKYLFHGYDPLSIEIPLYLDASLKFSTPEISFHVIEQKLFLTVKNQEDNTYAVIEKIASEISRCLPHTPVNSFGINHVFECDFDEVEKPLFEFYDNVKLAERGFIATVSQIKRSYKLQECTLNLTVAKEGEKVTFDFNYHFNLTSLAEFPIYYHEGDLVKMKCQSYDLLNFLYDLKIS